MNMIGYLKKNGMRAFIRQVVNRSLENIYPLLARNCHMKIKQKKVLFMNFNGKGYGGDPKYICEELRNLPEYDLVWAVSDKKSIISFPNEVRVIQLGSIRYYYELLTSRVWVDNVRKNHHIKKRKGQYYLQTWHGFVSLKKIEKDTEQSLSEKYIKDAKNDSAMADLIPCSSEARFKLIRNSFWYDGPIAKTGCPRMDVLYKARGKKDEIKSLLGLDKDSIYVTYAPTFRKDMGLKTYNVDLEMVKTELETRIAKEVKIIVRLHPNFGKVNLESEFGMDVINGSVYEDGQLLFAATDVLISDYSDSLFEAALSGSIVFIYASDVKDYIDDRGFYIDYYSLPFMIAENNEQMRYNIRNFDRRIYEKKLNIFWNSQGLYENGTSSESLAKWVREKCEETRGKI